MLLLEKRGLSGNRESWPILLANGSKKSIILSLGEIEENGVKRIIATMRLVEGDSVAHKSVQLAVESATENLMQDTTKALKGMMEDKLKGLYEQIEDYRIKTANLIKQLNKMGKDPEQNGSFVTIDTSKVVIKDVISSSGGSGAIVYTVNVDGWLCVMKEFDVKDHSKDQISNFESEIALLENLPVHKNIVRYLSHRRVDTKLQLFITKHETNLSKIIRAKRKEVRLFPFQN